MLCETRGKRPAGSWYSTIYLSAKSVGIARRLSGALPVTLELEEESITCMLAANMPTPGLEHCDRFTSVASTLTAMFTCD